MKRQSELERYEEWRSTFVLADEGPHTFRQLDKLRRIDNIVWNDISVDPADKLDKISGILTE